MNITQGATFIDYLDLTRGGTAVPANQIAEVRLAFYNDADNTQLALYDSDDNAANFDLTQPGKVYPKFTGTETNTLVGTSFDGVSKVSYEMYIRLTDNSETYVTKTPVKVTTTRLRPS